MVHRIRIVERACLAEGAVAMHVAVHRADEGGRAKRLGVEIAASAVAADEEEEKGCEDQDAKSSADCYAGFCTGGETF